MYKNNFENLETSILQLYIEISMLALEIVKKSLPQRIDASAPK